MVDRYHRLGSNFLNYFSQLPFMVPLLDGDCPTYAPLTAPRKIWVNGLARIGSSFGTIS
jgi:hypothetical protein